jgi:hypothetical protein
MTKRSSERFEMGRIAALVLALLGSSLIALAQQPDIIDAALERPLDARIDGELVRFGNPALDQAERAFHDGIPRPWTFANILPLFEVATADWLAAMDCRRSLRGAIDSLPDNGRSLCVPIRKLRLGDAAAVESHHGQ